MYLNNTLDVAHQQIAEKITRSQRLAQRREARAVHSPADVVTRGRRTWPWLLARRTAV